MQAPTEIPLSEIDADALPRDRSVTDTALMGAAVGLLLIGGRGVRRRRAEVLARWEREEALQDAIYRNLSGQGQPALPPAPAPPRWSHPEPHGVA